MKSKSPFTFLIHGPGFNVNDSSVHIIKKKKKL